MPQRASEFPVDVGRLVVATASWTIAVSHASTGGWCRFWLGLWLRLWLGFLFRFFSGRHLVQIWRRWQVDGRLFLNFFFLGLWSGKVARGQGLVSGCKLGLQFSTAGGTNLGWVDRKFADLLDRVASAQFTGVLAHVVASVDDDGKAGRVTGAALGVLLVVVHVDLVHATRRNALGPHHVFDGSTRVGLDVRINVEDTATWRFLGPTVDALP